jgi:hypothetical protein
LRKSLVTSRWSLVDVHRFGEDTRQYEYNQYGCKREGVSTVNVNHPLAAIYMQGENDA